MAKKNAKATPVAPEAPRPPEPATPTLTDPFEDELDRQSLERVRRFLVGRESLVAVYGEDWPETAQLDLRRVVVHADLDDQPRTDNYLTGLRDGLLAARDPDRGLKIVRVRLDPKVEAPVETPVGTKRKGYRPAPGRSVLEI